MHTQQSAGVSLIRIRTGWSRISLATPLAEPLPLATPLAAPLPLTAPPIADAPLVKPELPKTPTLPDMRYVKREATKVQKQTKYDDELSRWRELKQLYM